MYKLQNNQALEYQQMHLKGICTYINRFETFFCKILSTYTLF